MEKMSIIFYLLTLFGVLLVPTYVQSLENSTDISTNVTNPRSDKEKLDVNISTTVSNETGAAEDISSVTQSVSSIPEPSTGVFSGSPKDNVTIASKTTNQTKDETTTRSTTKKKTPTKVPPVGPSPSTKDKTEKTTTGTPAPDTNGNTKGITKSVPGADGKTEGSQDSSSEYIMIILVVICLIIFCITIFCVYRGDRRKYAVDTHAKNEDAQVPLALVETDLCDVSPKAMKTFASAEESSPTGTGEKTEEEKGSETVTQSPREKNEDYENDQNFTPVKGRENITSSESVYQSLNPATNQLDSVYHTLTVTSNS